MYRVQGFRCALYTECRDSGVRYVQSAGIQGCAMYGMQGFRGALCTECRDSGVCYVQSVGIQRCATYRVQGFRGALCTECRDSGVRYVQSAGIQGCTTYRVHGARMCYVHSAGFRSALCPMCNISFPLLLLCSDLCTQHYAPIPPPLRTYSSTDLTPTTTLRSKPHICTLSYLM
ncbi:hypothetical protein AB205_0027560, partial [Aquarana catesbeiana]